MCIVPLRSKQDANKHARFPAPAQVLCGLRERPPSAGCKYTWRGRAPSEPHSCLLVLRQQAGHAAYACRPVHCKPLLCAEKLTVSAGQRCRGIAPSELAGLTPFHAGPPPPLCQPAWMPASPARHWLPRTRKFAGQLRRSLALSLPHAHQAGGPPCMAGISPPYASRHRCRLPCGGASAAYRCPACNFPP